MRRKTAVSDRATPLENPLLLTNREREILIWVSRGKRNAEIATILLISPGTVRKHLENIYGKLGVSNRGGAVGALLGSPSSSTETATLGA